MTNSEKYKEIFGMEPDYVACPTNDCNKCLMHGKPGCTNIEESWWNGQYEEPIRKKENKDEKSNSH